ncbi:MAG: hypothetical protein LBI72_06695 [Flavobacteriaceae bacterium]|jgi:hypothetical protein|nr:hypothetical protein [Flavobacteriaceae bacterium]
MISIEKCRKVLKDNDEHYTDKEIEEIRAFLYKMSKIVVESDQNGEYGKS